MINFDSEGLVDNVSIATLPAPRHHYSATTCWSGHSGEMPEFTPVELEVVPVLWADVPLTTWAGDVWMRPTKLASASHAGACAKCPVLDLCQEQVTAGGYCGCEKVLVGELMV